MKPFLFIAAALLALSACKKKDSNGQPAAIDERSTGASAHELLSAGTYSSLTVEIRYMTGFQPDAGALAQLQSFLEARLNKPGGINIVSTESGSTASGTLSVSDISGVENAVRSQHSSGSHATVFILFTNGYYTEPNVLGVAYGGTSLALFGRKIHENSGGFGQASRTKLEATVLEHEIGHLLGLVDLGSPMQVAHKDPGGTAHCNNQSCLMYYAVETTDVLGFLITGSVPPFDANCLADLRANGGK